MAYSNQFFPELIRSINKLNLALSNIKINEYLLTLAKSVVYLFEILISLFVCLLAFLLKLILRFNKVVIFQALYSFFLLIFIAK